MFKGKGAGFILPLVVAMMLRAVGVSAQQGVSATVTSYDLTPGCSQTQSGAAVLVANCSVTKNGASGSASASYVGGPGGSVTASVNVVGSASLGVSAEASSNWGAVYTVGGPLSQIFRAVAHSSATVIGVADLPWGMPFGDVFMYAFSNYVTPPVGGPGYSGSNDEMRTNGGFISRGLAVGILGEAIQQSHQIFIGIEAVSYGGTGTNRPTAYGFATATLPEISFYDVNGVDITNQFTLTNSAVVSTPEPASMMLVGSGLAGLAGFRRTRRARAASV